MTPSTQTPSKNHRLIEKLSADDYTLITNVLATKDVAADWPRAWAEVADDRLALARNHLEVAQLMVQACADRGWDLVGRSVISRAYYSMFAAARAAVALENSADENDHRKLPAVINKMTALGPADVRHSVYGALSKFRIVRNNADYSAYYPEPLEDDALAALASAEMVLRTCQNWVAETKRKRGL